MTPPSPAHSRAACVATGTPLLTAARPRPPGTPSRSRARRRGQRRGRGSRERALGRGTGRDAAGTGDRARSAAIDLGRVVRERSAALLPAGSAELAARACAELAALAGDLRRIGVDGDALVWVPRGERVPAQALAALLRDGPDAGLSVLIGTTSPAAAAELGGTGGDRAHLSRRRPGPGHQPRRADRHAAAPAVARRRAGRQRRLPTRAGGTRAGRPAFPASLPSRVAIAAAGPCALSGDPGADPADARPGEFVLAVSWPRQRLIAPGRWCRPGCRAGRPRQAAGRQAGRGRRPEEAAA